MKYSYTAKNYGKDLIYCNRLELMCKKEFNYNKTAQRYQYFMAAYLGIILTN